MSNGQQTTTEATTIVITSPAMQLTPHFQDVPVSPSAVDLVAEFKGSMATDGLTKRVIFKDGRVVFSSSDLPHNVAFTFDDDGVLCRVELLING
jgi:hypothetical protein